MFFIKLRYLQR